MLGSQQLPLSLLNSLLSSAIKKGQYYSSYAPRPALPLSSRVSRQFRGKAVLLWGFCACLRFGWCRVSECATGLLGRTSSIGAALFTGSHFGPLPTHRSSACGITDHIHLAFLVPRGNDASDNCGGLTTDLNSREVRYSLGPRMDIEGRISVEEANTPSTVRSNP